jgi:hypothetical protein
MPLMTEPVQMLLGVAKDRPDPRAVSTWLMAYLGTRPLKAKFIALDGLAAQVKSLTPAPDKRVLGLVLGVIDRTRAGLER